MTHVSLIQISAGIAVLLPLLTSVIKQDRFSKAVNSYIALGVAVVAAAVETYAQSGLTLANFGTSLVTTYSVAQVTYAGLWSPSSLAPKIQKVTSIKPRPVTLQNLVGKLNSLDVGASELVNLSGHWVIESPVATAQTTTKA